MIHLTSASTGFSGYSLAVARIGLLYRAAFQNAVTSDLVFFKDKKDPLLGFKLLNFDNIFTHSAFIFRFMVENRCARCRKFDQS